jgi:hypothetical protein
MKRIKNSSLKRQIYLRCKIILRKYSNELSNILNRLSVKKRKLYLIVFLALIALLLCLRMFFSFVYIKREESNRIKIEEEYRVRLDSISLEIDKREMVYKKAYIRNYVDSAKIDRVYELADSLNYEQAD